MSEQNAEQKEVISEAIDLVIELENGQERMVSAIKASASLTELARIKEEKIDRCLQVKDTFSSEYYKGLDIVTNRLGSIDHLLDVYASQLESVQERLNSEFHSACRSYACFLPKDKQGLRKKLDDIAADFNGSRQALGTGSISAHIINYSGFLNKVNAANRKFDAMFEEYMASDYQDNDRLGAFAKSFEDNVVKQYALAIKKHKKLSLPFGVQQQHIDYDATRLAEAERFNRRLQDHIKDFKRIKEHSQDIKNCIHLIEEQKNKLDMMQVYAKDDIIAIKSIQKSINPCRYDNIDHLGNLKTLIIQYSQASENIKAILNRKINEARERLEADASELGKLQNIDGLYEAAGKIDIIKDGINSSKELSDKFDILGIKDGQKMMQELAQKLSLKLANLSLYVKQLKNNVELTRSGFEDCSTIDGIARELYSRKNSLRIISEDMPRLGSAASAYGLDADSILAAETYLAKTEEHLNHIRDLRERVMQDCRKLSNALEVGDYNEAYVDIAKYDSFREKPFAAMLNEQIEEYKSLSEKMARIVRKEKAKLQPIVVQKKVVYGFGGNGARAEVPSYYTPKLTVDDVARASSVKPNKGSFMNDFEQLRKIKPRTSMYSEVSDVLLGEPTAIMPERGFWNKRMDVIANAVNGYQPLETDEDMAYFRDVASSLVNSMENGLLRTLSGISRKNEEAAKNAINSIMYLIDRSEKAQAA